MTLTNRCAATILTLFSNNKFSKYTRNLQCELHEKQNLQPNKGSYSHEIRMFVRLVTLNLVDFDELSS